MQYRRFGKTELQIPVISCGGMRYQQSWKDYETDKVTPENQRNLEACIHRAVELGVNHIETARGYGTSEYQLGKILPTFQRDKIIVQTKVGPSADVSKFVEEFEKSMGLLQLDYVDIFSFHGVNTPECLENTKKCMDTALQWKKEGRIRDIGFSTHGPLSVITDAIKTDMFEHVNLHWYYIFQNNWPAVLEATKRDMGVFIISPNDKGGLLYKPSQKLIELCAPLHPMVFNGLFCLARPEVHTLSCGVSCPEDFDIHMETVRLMDQAAEHIAPIESRLHEALVDQLGEDWVANWEKGLPEWDETPGDVNIPVVLRLWNYAKAFDMVEYGKMRYGLLGNGGHWFPGKKLEGVDLEAVTATVAKHPYASVIPERLQEAHALLKGEEKKRLQE
ncbi:MAG: aldo/keto reductase [Candidatus Hydrogenedentes bacterium]|nr:aldo/keto reductase [Candidatus Hydrogenedentota bacterium]